MMPAQIRNEPVDSSGKAMLDFLPQPDDYPGATDGGWDVLAFFTIFTARVS